jgi:DNA-binding transcriptional MerR regulator
VGISPHTLRAWENRYGAVAPKRSATGRRLYSAPQLDRLERLVELVNLGHGIGSVAHLSDAELVRLSRRSAEGMKSRGRSTTQRELFQELERGVATFNLNLVASLLEQRRSALGTRSFVLDVLIPLLQWIGMAVASGLLSVAHEHALSAVVKDQIYQTHRYGSNIAVRKGLPHIVLATPEDDWHEFGILLASALLSHYEIPAHLLGANLPADALGIAVRAVKGEVVILGNAPVPEEDRKVSLDQFLQKAHGLLPPAVEVWIGGGGKVPHLRRVMPGRVCRVLSSMEELDGILAKMA